MAAVSPPNQYVYFDDNVVKVCEPVVPLAPGAIEIKVAQGVDGRVASEKIFDTYSRLKAIWASKNAREVGCFYLEKHNAATGTSMIQIIPYPARGVKSYVCQVRVAWNNLFPNRAFTSHPTDAQKESLKSALADDRLPVNPWSDSPKTDAFCNPERIKAQAIFKHKNIHFLANFKPLLEHDNLAVTDEHQKLFDKEMFTQARTLGVKVLEIYAKHGYPIGYLTFADDKASGQTVPHANLHQTVAKNFREELWAHAKVIRKIFIDSWAQFIVPSLFKLSDAQLKVKIAAENQILTEVQCSAL